MSLGRPAALRALGSSVILWLLITVFNGGTTQATPSPAGGTSVVPGATTSVGIDELRQAGFDLLRDSSVGLVTNHTGRAADGTSTIDLLHRADRIRLVRLFSPEHGLRGTAENGSVVDDGRDPATGLPVVSLYREESRQPQPEHLADLDTLVFDIQDCGVRFYTYISTLFLSMEAAAGAGIRCVVLDRPNPIRADRVEGPLPAGGTAVSFTCPHPIPVRHGMSVGELAGLYQAEAPREKGLKELRLDVVKMSGYRRDMWFDDTGLPWHGPSPNLPTLASATLYPGIGILEFLNISVGRGTGAPFLTVGAPFLDAQSLARHLAASKPAGIRVEATRFTPTKSVFAGASCGGIRIHVTDRDRCMPLDIGLSIAAYLARKHREESRFLERADTLLRHPLTIAALLRNDPIGSWEKDLAAFDKRRARFLLYP